VISFAGGLPAPELFPVEALKDVCNAVLNEEGAASLQYSTTEGYIPLREAISQRMKVIGINSTLKMFLSHQGPSKQSTLLEDYLSMREIPLFVKAQPILQQLTYSSHTMLNLLK
jgi:2-aminoadipate transaminase